MNELLDRIDPSRFDTEEIRDRLNAFQDLDPDEADKYLGSWEYAGLDEAEHPLTELLGESHNRTYVVRDLDGTLVLLWEKLPSGYWEIGPLYAQHLPSKGELVEMPAHDVDYDLVRELTAKLPLAPGPVRSY